MKETNVEVEGIKLAVSMFRKTDPKRCREVLLDLGKYPGDGDSIGDK